MVRKTFDRLFPGVAGMLYIYRESRDVLEHVATWGGEETPEPILGPDDCWALRLGRPHFVHREGTIRCQHAHNAGQSYVCKYKARDKCLGCCISRSPSTALPSVPKL